MIHYNDPSALNHPYHVAMMKHAKYQLYNNGS